MGPYLESLDYCRESGRPALPRLDHGVIRVSGPIKQMRNGARIPTKISKIFSECRYMPDPDWCREGFCSRIRENSDTLRVRVPKSHDFRRRGFRRCGIAHGDNGSGVAILSMSSSNSQESGLCGWRNEKRTAALSSRCPKSPVRSRSGCQVGNHRRVEQWLTSSTDSRRTKPLSYRISGRPRKVYNKNPCFEMVSSRPSNPATFHTCRRRQATASQPRSAGE